MHIKQRHFIKGSEIKTLKTDVLNHFDEKFVEQIFPNKCRIEWILTEAGDTLYAVNGQLVLWKSKDGFIPVLTLLLKNNQINLKKIVVDKGAIRFITDSADVMRPGITDIDPTIKKDDIVQIVDETHDRTLAIGKAMLDAKEMESKTSGKVIKNLHTIKDSVWEFEKEFK